MASERLYLDYVLDLLSEVRDISYRKMMGEYVLYQNGLVFGGIYDNRFLIKKTKSFVGKNMNEEIPYPNAKSMILVDCENSEEVKELVMKVINDLEQEQMIKKTIKRAKAKPQN